MQSDNIGRYRIEKELGRGAMGTVYLAYDPQIERHVAIKTIQIFAALPDSERDTARARFLREARAAGKLLHPGIVTVFDVGEADGIPYLAMEYVRGATLDAFCRPQTLLGAETATEIVARAAEALAFAHQAGIVHRDIKPANLMRVGDTEVKIMDFGLARGAESQITQDGALLGTPSYMSPEQIRSAPLDGRSDLFSLAAVLYEMLSGEKPFGGDSVSSIIFRVVNEDPRDLRELQADIAPSLADFLVRALTKDPAARFPDGNAFAGALREAARGVPSETQRIDAPAAAAAAPGLIEPVPEEQLPAPPTVDRPRSSLSKGLIAFFILSIVIGAAGAGFYFYEDRIMEFINPSPKEIWLEAKVRTDPPGLPISFNGEPLADGSVRFKPDGPAGRLETRVGCRTVSHELTAADAGGEVVLVPDPAELDVSIDAGVPGATIELNGASAGTVPATLSLDLCRDNTIALKARDYREARVEIPAGATPLEARTAVAGLSMAEVPKGRLIAPAVRDGIRLTVDGRRVEPGEAIELSPGTYTVRAVREDLWIDVRRRVEVRPGEDTQARIDIPGIATLVVQAFPANCAVYLRRPGGDWKFVDDVPMQRKIAAGAYEVKVVLKPTGAERVREIRLSPGRNPPVRVSFGRS